MSRHKNSMRDIAGGSNIAAKRRVIQRGGFLGALLGTVLPLAIKGISALVGHIKRKKNRSVHTVGNSSAVLLKFI